VEFDTIGWEKREWLQLYKDNFHIFLVEDSLCVSKRISPPPSSVTGKGSIHPALVWDVNDKTANKFKSLFTRITVDIQAFKPLVDRSGFWKTKHAKPIEFIVDLKVEFHDYSELQYLKVLIKVSVFFELHPNKNNFFRPGTQILTVLILVYQINNLSTIGGSYNVDIISSWQHLRFFWVLDLKYIARKERHSGTLPSLLAIMNQQM